MRSKTWLLTFAVSVLLIILVVAGMNISADPFGVFGDRIFKWYAFNMTENPRAAKIAYLDANKEKYDSFVLGASGTSSLSPETLKHYTGEEYYNLFVYGADMRDTRDFAEYVINNYGAKSIMLNMALACAVVYDEPKTDVTRYMHANADGSSKLEFYLNYMFANPRYALQKIADSQKRGYLQQPFAVFAPETGTYDKSSRDVEVFGDLNGYFVKYPVFKEVKENKKTLGKIKECAESLAEIKKTCDDAGVALTVIFPPMYAPDAANYDPAEIAELFESIAEITEFWDFSMSPISADPRYFYDTTHFRNAVGEMMLARIYGDPSKYVPNEFGTLVTKENASQQAANFSNEWGNDDSDRAVELPILTYHHIEIEGNGTTIIAENAFEEQIKALSKAGYNAVLPRDIVDFVEKGTPLPKKPVLITFDDGYSSNYETAFPILEKYEMKAAIFVIGVSAGRDTYKETGVSIYPHFGAAEMAEMVGSGVISIESHTYDMHNSKELDDPETFRNGVLQRKNETESEYVNAFKEDIKKSLNQIETATGERVRALAYPGGARTHLSDVLLNELGIKATFVTEPGINTILKGLPQTLLNLKRFTVTDSVTPEELIMLLENK